jgi:galactose mutarotase-like enzyme
MDGALPRLILENDQLRAVILPTMGGKVGSLRALPEDAEFLQQPLRPYGPRTRTMAFEEGDASGYDECIPSVSGCEIPTRSGTLQIPDHGDFWRLPCEVLAVGRDEAVLESTGFSLPLRFRKTIQLDGSRLLFSYALHNSGSDTIEYLWSAHPGFAVESGDRVVLPPSVDRVTVEGSASGRLGAPGSLHRWPLDGTGAGSAGDLSLVGSESDKIGDKLFAAAPAEGWCALERRRLGRRLTMRFDSRFATHLGLWLCYAGWPQNGTRKQFCVAMEPCTAPTDSLAVAIRNGWGRSLAPQAEDRWQVEVQIRNLEGA